MIPYWPGLVEDSECKGWEDGSHGRTYSPIMQWGICQEADDAYIKAYWHGVAYGFVTHSSGR